MLNCPSMRVFAAFVLRKHRVFQAAVVTLLILVCFIYGYTKRWNFDISRMICVGSQFLPPGGVSKEVSILRRSAGYDGQFFYYIALDPFADKKDLQHLDAPAYRLRRIGYPLLAAVLSFGLSRNLPYTLVMTNVLAIIFTVVLLALFAKKNHRDPRLALFYVFSGMLLIPLARDLSEPCAVAFMVGGLFFYSRRKFVLSGLFFAYSILCREIMCAVLPVLVLDWLFLKKNPRSWIAPVIAAVAQLGWHLYVGLYIGAGKYPSAWGIHGSSIAVIEHLQYILFEKAHALLSEKIVLVSTVGICVLSVALAIRQCLRSLNVSSICLLGYALLPLLLSQAVWVEPWAYCRMVLPALALAIWCYFESGDKLFFLPLGLNVISFVAILDWLRVI